MKKALLALLVCALAYFGFNRAARAQSKPLNVTGAWQIDFHDDDGLSQTSPQLVLTQTADKLTGTFGLDDWPVTGAVDGVNVVFTFVAHGHEDGKPISDAVFYWGAIDPSGLRMNGRMKNPKEAGDWIATRK